MASRLATFILSIHFIVVIPVYTISYSTAHMATTASLFYPFWSAARVLLANIILFEPTQDKILSFFSYRVDTDSIETLRG